jgi:hypothetical protein
MIAELLIIASIIGLFWYAGMPLLYASIIAFLAFALYFIPTKLKVSQKVNRSVRSGNTIIWYHDDIPVEVDVDGMTYGQDAAQMYHNERMNRD